MKIGFLLPHLGPTQQAFRIIHNSNEVLRDELDKDIVVFYENLIKPCQATGFATMNIADAWNYPGNLVTTTLSTAHKSLGFPGPTNKYFYIVDLEWTKIRQKRYETLAEVYQHPDLKLLARSAEHAKCIEEAWARPVRGIIKDFDIKALAQIIKEDENAIGTHKRIL